MVSSLPNEIILDILELAANASPAATLNLCLLSSTTARSIRSMLYRKVRLDLLHDTQVPSPKSRRPSPGPCSTPRTSATYTCTLWVLYTSRNTAFYAAMEPVATTCANLEELACAADWLLDRLYQNQGRRSRGALAEFRHLKCLRLFDADALSVTQMISISAPITVTHLHLVEPVKGGTKAFLSDVAPSLHSLAFLCLESLTECRPPPWASPQKHITSLLRVIPSSTSIAIKLDVSACSPPRER